MNQRLHCKHRVLYALGLLWGYQSAGICAAFVPQERHRSRLQPTYDSTVEFESRRMLSETTATALYSSTLKFKNFDMMLDAFRDEPVLVYFSSNDCGRCKLQKKELLHIRNRFFGTVPTTSKKILTIDADTFPQICLRYDVTKLPCLLFINNGHVQLRLDGFTTAEDIVNRMQQTTNLHGFCTWECKSNTLPDSINHPFILFLSLNDFVSWDNC